MFRNDDWHRRMEKAGLMPILVGNDLHRLSEDDREIPKVLVLAVPRQGNKAAISMQSFFRSLRGHTYDAVANVLTFADWNLAINVCSLNSLTSLNAHDTIILEDPACLFNAVGRLTTTVLDYEAGARLRDIKPGLFGGLCKRLPQSAADVQTVCSVALRHGNGMPVYQRFERHRCPPVREIMAMYLEEEIGPWRFEEQVLRLDNYTAWKDDSRRQTWPDRYRRVI
ncbi:hypothetical protein EDB80DRAFT_884438 [Ilyonectria destructans]|nr:hypothetical protein EDB80DRAFT_884438 [Ilyonectria destructans]